MWTMEIADRDIGDWAFIKNAHISLFRDRCIFLGGGGLSSPSVFSIPLRLSFSFVKRVKGSGYANVRLYGKMLKQYGKVKQQYDKINTVKYW